MFHHWEHSLLKGRSQQSIGGVQRLGNLRSTTKFTTTTSVDRESTGARTSVSAGNRKLKMQSLGRTTTALNVNKL